MCNKYKNIVCYILVLFCILITDTVSLPLNSTQKDLIAIIICFIYIINSLYVDKFYVDYNFILWVAIPIIFILFSQLINLEASPSYECKIIFLLFGFFFCKRLKFEKFIEIYINIMFVIAISSLVMFLSVRLGFNWWKILPVTNDGLQYSLGITAVSTTKYGQIRNYGPFWEPGVYQIYLNLAIIFCLFKKKKLELKKIIIFVATVLTTLSTTGYICTGCIFVIYFIGTIKHINIKMLFIILGAFGLLIGIGSIPFVREQVFNKIINRNNSRSFMTRTHDLKLYFHIWLENIIFGTGLIGSYTRAISEYAKNSFFNDYFGTAFTGSTTTTMREFAGLGFLFGMTRVIIQWKFAVFLSKKFFVRIGIFMIILIFLNTEPLIYSLLFNVVFYYGVTGIYKYEKLSLVK